MLPRTYGEVLEDLKSIGDTLFFLGFTVFVAVAFVEAVVRGVVTPDELRP
jgi:hypothetical protein